MFPVLMLTGATCTGKTSIAVSVAKQTQAVLLPLDQLQRYTHLREGVGLDPVLLAQVEHYGYQILSPWEVSGPEEYSTWLKDAIPRYAVERPIVIEGCCTSYLRKILDLRQTEPLFKQIKIYALDIVPNDPLNIANISRLCSLEKTQRIIEETKSLVADGFISEPGLPLLQKCEKLFKHPKHANKSLAWAIRISAKVYCPAYLSLTGRITVSAARERIILNIREIQDYQNRRIHKFLQETNIIPP